MKTLLITGAAKNTGLAIAEKFAFAGYCVALTSRDPAGAEKAAKGIQEKYGTLCKGYGLDLCDVKAVETVFHKVKKEFGSLDVFIANAAELGIGLPMGSCTEEDYYRVTEVNLKGTFFCCRTAAEIMKEQGGGAIVTIGSVQGTGAVPGRALYSMTKAAYGPLVRSIAYEYGSFGVRANDLVCGAIHTERWDALSEKETEERRKRYPAGREASTFDVAEAAYYLGSGLSGCVTGASLTLDSGLSACLVPFEKKEK